MSEMTPADLKILERTPLFQTLPRRHRKRIAELATVKHYGNDEIIVRQGDPGDSFVVMLRGDVLVAPSAGDERLVVSDEYFGELSLIDGEPRAATVSAAGPVTVACIDRKDFRALLADEPALAVGLLPGVTLIARDLLRADARDTARSLPGRRVALRRDRSELVEAAGSEIEGRDALSWLLLLRHVGVFEALSEAHLHRVAKLFTIERFADGDTVVLAGARGDSLHIILNGRARVRTPGGHTRDLGADDCFGELALIDGAPRSATVVAVGELTTAKLADRLRQAPQGRARHRRRPLDASSDRPRHAKTAPRGMRTGRSAQGRQSGCRHALGDGRWTMLLERSGCVRCSPAETA